MSPLGPAVAAVADTLSAVEASSDEDIWARDGLDARYLREVDVAGTATRVYDAGSGEALLLVHGGQFGSLYSLDAWSLNLPELARHFRVVAFDKIGQGYTANPVRPEDHVVETVLDHAFALVEQLGVDRIHVVGHSRGGFVAARLAIERPDLVRSLVLVDAGSVAPYDPGIPVGAFYAPLEDPRLWRTPDRATVVAEPEAQAIRSGWITDDFIERMLRIAVLPKTLEARRRFKEAEIEHWRPSLALLRSTTLRAIDDGRLSVPTMVLWGYEDRSAPRHQGHRLYERIAAATPTASFQMVNHAGHYVFRDRPSFFNEAITSFCLGAARAVVSA